MHPYSNHGNVFRLLPSSEHSLLELSDAQHPSSYSCRGIVIAARWGFYSASDLSNLVATWFSRNVHIVQIRLALFAATSGDQ